MHSSLIHLVQKRYPQWSWSIEEDMSFEYRLAESRLKEIYLAMNSARKRCAEFCTLNEKERFASSPHLIQNMRLIEDVFANNIKVYEKKLIKLQEVIEKNIFAFDDQQFFQHISYELEYLYTDTITGLMTYNPFYRYAPAGNQSYHAYHGSNDDIFMRYNKPTMQRPITEYRRNSSQEIVRFEQRMAKVMGLNDERHTMVATSSACAAFIMLLGYLKYRKKEKPLLKVMISESGYSEFVEILKCDPGISVIYYSNKDSTDPTEDCISDCKREKPDIIVLETISNHLKNRFVDIEAVIQSFGKDEIFKGIDIICDDTLTPLSFSELYNKVSDEMNLFRITSGCKYLNMGMDRISCGFLTARKEHEDALKNNFRTLYGATLYEDASYQFPLSFDMIHERNQRIERNATLFCELFNNVLKDTGLVASHPRSCTHDDGEQLEKRNDVFTGGLVTIGYNNHTISDEAVFNACQDVIARAAAHKLDMVFATSFGQTAPRIWPCRLPADAAGMRYRYFRYYAGARSLEDVFKAATIVIETMRDCLLQGTNDVRLDQAS